NGANDTPATAEHIVDFGTGKRAASKIALTGHLRPDDTIPALPLDETDDSIGLASDTGISGTRPAVRATAAIGDGPHGSAGDRTGDFDFYRVDGGASGLTFTARTSTPTGDLDTMLALYDADATLLDVSGDHGGSTDSSVTFAVAPNQVVYLVVGSDPFALPSDPTTPGTGPGVATEGPYDLLITSGRSSGDLDYYSFDLRAGDVLGASITGGGTRLAVHDPAGREVFGSSQDLTSIFAADSPMPGGGNAVVDFVAPVAGRYRLGVEAGEGAYDVKLEAFRPGTETAPRGSVHTIFLDFDGARVNTTIFGGGGGLRDLSPLSSFLPGWQLTARDERALITAITATVRENLERDMVAAGLNPRFALRILNSRDHADPWGQPNVSRVVVGGTVAESGINTVGIAQSIDAGNFGREETALVLLDRLSGPAGPALSLNSYVRPESDRIAFIGRAIGNITSHEAGHMSGSWHTDLRNDVHGLMDPGGDPSVQPDEDRRLRATGEPHPRCGGRRSVVPSS
ncbi:PPC domain-containing protein, partial [Actinosynnema sp. NPDC023658]|uniref:PPC domain-containing protein n=1 Tax=Actinosynnema sp. NPDC023658 TaxID=3155465 RepID=UPI0033EC24F4